MAKRNNDPYAGLLNRNKQSDILKRLDPDADVTEEVPAVLEAPKELSAQTIPADQVPVNFTVRMPKGLRLKAKTRAGTLGKSVQDYIQYLIERDLQENPIKL